MEFVLIHCWSLAVRCRLFCCWRYQCLPSAASPAASEWKAAGACARLRMILNRTPLPGVAHTLIEKGTRTSTTNLVSTLMAFFLLYLDSTNDPPARQRAPCEGDLPNRPSLVSSYFLCGFF